jgi:hypothetical protein
MKGIDMRRLRIEFSPVVCLIVVATSLGTATSPTKANSQTHDSILRLEFAQASDPATNSSTTSDQAFPRPKPVKVHPVDSSGQPIPSAPAIIESVNEKGEAKNIIYTGRVYWQRIQLGKDKIIRASTEFDAIDCNVTTDFALADPISYSKKFITINLSGGCESTFGKTTMNFGASGVGSANQPPQHNNHFVLAPDNGDTSGYTQNLERVKAFDGLNFSFITEKLSLIQLRISKGPVGASLFSEF